ncbi:MAG: iron-containing alcohol dehydrogenase [Candidatus Dormibacteria bacterium]
MTAPVAVDLARVERVYTGDGVHARLGEELERSGIRRALLLTGRSLAAGRLVDRLRVSCGGRLAGEYHEVAAHNPTSSVDGAAAAYAAADCDGIVAFGAGSVVDCAKAVAHRQATAPPLIDVATGLSGAEFACSFGQTDETTRVKGGWRDPRLFARAVFLDPGMTAETPSWLWFATGMRAVDHAVETILADNAHPYLDTLAGAALGELAGPSGILLESASTEMAGELPMDLRLRCMVASWMAHAGSLHVQWGLSHQMGRQLGPAFGIPHGHTSSIFLPAVVELTASAHPAAALRLAGSLGVESAAAVAPALRELVRSLELPATLRASGISDRSLVEQLFGGNDRALAVVDRAW